MDKAELLDRLRLPLMAAPMSIASTPELVTACCRAGVMGCFPTHNAWKDTGLGQWLEGIDSSLRHHADRTGSAPAPYAVNINVSRAKPAELLMQEIDLCRRHNVQIITTNVGDPSDVVAQVHDWGGIVIHDAVSVAQAERAVAAGVDGLMLVCAGAGGLGGNLSPMAFAPRVRSFFDGLIQVAGGVCTGGGIRAALALGADMACMGTLFIATEESGVHDDHKRMLVRADLADVVWTDAICGIAGSFLRPSLLEHGLDPKNLPPLDTRRRPTIPRHIKPWRMVFSGGHSVAGIADVPTVADRVAELERQYVG
ncbi:NAD(P)H-dependent flavin oxidoreductase [Mycolicibacterium porcinum]|uniref:Nitronate monooxygenase n=2 Tax=Actinomycetes TaxID=1760 RepID=A0AAW5T0E8_9MYCO|nr:nitronate monooxygenase [Mycolicibacterium porcinum]MCV7388023.1 nitronate monooxygenase [Mycolicibacterium porcinum]CDO31291.1 2-nitropropane dioxygenase [Mycolicibacterium vulneris]